MPLRSHWIAPLFLSVALLAQARVPPGPLAELHERYEQQRLQLVKQGASFEDLRDLTLEFTKQLEDFLAQRARGDDVFNARLMLVDYLLSIGERERAVARLRELDPAAAPPLILVGAAQLAAHLGLDAERDRWVDAAIAKKDSLQNRMALATHLATRLLEPEKAEKIFAEALQQAKDDEARAEVEWYRALAIAEREDLHEEAYDEALEALAERYPKTRYGSIAADRLKAREMKPGSPAIPLELPLRGGGEVSLSDYSGKVLLLDFWASWCGPCRSAAPREVALYDEYHDRGFEVLGISMEENGADLDRAAKELGFRWKHAFDGQGLATEAALRYAIGQPGQMILIGKDGKIVVRGLSLLDEAGAKEAAELIESALK